MIQIARKSDESTPIEEKGTTTGEKVKNTLTDELVIGICAPIGTSKKIVIQELKKQLEENYNYETQEIKLSEYIKKYSEAKPLEIPNQTAAYTEMMNKIKGGDELREKYKLNSILVDLAIQEITTQRHPVGQDKLDVIEMKSRRICYIIDSLKNTEETRVLRSIYRDIFYLFSIFSPLDERKENLIGKNISPEEADKLVKTDEFENNDHGQNIRNTFTDGDFFVRISKNNLADNISNKIQRYLKLVFDQPVVTPFPNETAMYAAKSAAANSACLSRQVGAAITNEESHILAEGWNDVPRYKGGLYNELDGDNDKRCWVHGKKCSNDSKKDDISNDVVEMIFSNSKLTSFFKPEVIENLQKHVEAKNVLKEIIRKQTPVKDLIEFSRAVHAEMHAIINGSQQTGIQMRGGKLFCTTYPCHNCARHIVAAGIKEVYYIEPYTKSLCTELHEDSLTENETSENKVKILMYDGVAPRRYLEFFSMQKDRKTNGLLYIQDSKQVVPKNRITLQALSSLEEQAVQALNEKGVKRSHE